MIDLDLWMVTTAHGGRADGGPDEGRELIRWEQRSFIYEKCLHRSLSFDIQRDQKIYMSTWHRSQGSSKPRSLFQLVYKYTDGLPPGFLVRLHIKLITTADKPTPVLRRLAGRKPEVVLLFRSYILYGWLHAIVAKNYLVWCYIISDSNLSLFHRNELQQQNHT